jgi:hypothetical protein
MIFCQIDNVYQNDIAYPLIVNGHHHLHHYFRLMLRCLFYQDDNVCLNQESLYPFLFLRFRYKHIIIDCQSRDKQFRNIQEGTI